jgi:antitoxin component of RelBE/YafQ-DinJ toxin-antitoxin module
MPQTRIAEDVWELAQEVSDRMGLNSPRLAIEAIVRVCASHYTSNTLQPHHPLIPQPVPAKAEAIEPTASAEDDAAAALSDLMQSFA